MTRAEMQARFHELVAQREAILAVSLPMREARDAYAQEAQAQVATMNAGIQTAETGLFDIDQEKAAIARYLNGQTGSPNG